MHSVHCTQHKCRWDCRTNLPHTLPLVKIRISILVNTPPFKRRINRIEFALSLTTVYVKRLTFHSLDTFDCHFPVLVLLVVVWPFLADTLSIAYGDNRLPRVCFHSSFCSSSSSSLFQFPLLVPSFSSFFQFN